MSDNGNNSNEYGALYVVTGPSGAGKDSVIDKAREMGLEFGQVVTTSTRAMRVGESEGNPYYFVNREEFEDKIENGEMIEWAEVYGNLYGSSKEEVERVRRANDVVIMKVDPQGARTIKELVPDSEVIFIQPPSIEFLERRLNKRGSDTPDIIAKRLEVAEDELKQLDQWDHIVVNEEDQLESTAQNVMGVMGQ